MQRTGPAILRVRVVGHSMAPTILDGDVIWVCRRRRVSLIRGDVVVFRNPLAAVEPKLLVKRVARVVGASSSGCTGRIEVYGDNPRSLGSAQLGSISCQSVLGVAVWPWRLRRRKEKTM